MLRRYVFYLIVLFAVSCNGAKFFASERGKNSSNPSGNGGVGAPGPGSGPGQNPGAENEVYDPNNPNSPFYGNQDFPGGTDPDEPVRYPFANEPGGQTGETVPGFLPDDPAQGPGNIYENDPTAGDYPFPPGGDPDDPTSPYFPGDPDDHEHPGYPGGPIAGPGAPGGLPDEPGAFPVPGIGGGPVVCRDETIPLGLQVAFLIDNSASNLTNDCPGRVGIGTECPGVANRERGIYAVIDNVLFPTANRSGHALSKSSFSIATFPTWDNQDDGAEVQLGWQEAVPSARQQVSEIMRITRNPVGFTPFGAAMAAAEQLFSQTNAQDPRPRYAVLVTDAEPTDQHPSIALQRAKRLRDAGVRIITVRFTGHESWAERVAHHREVLRQKRPNFRPDFPSFDTYVATMLGLNGSPSLAELMSSKRDRECQDGGIAGQCSRRVYDVAGTHELGEALRYLLRPTGVATH